MAQTIRQRDIEGMVKRLAQAMQLHGMLTHSLGFERGSKANGNSYVLLMGGDRSPFGTYHWGFTAHEFYDRLLTMAVALEQAAWVREKAGK